MSIKKKFCLFGLLVGIILLFLPGWFGFWGEFTELIYKYFLIILPWIGEDFMGQFVVYYFLAIIVLLTAKLFRWKIDPIFYSMGLIIIFILFLMAVFIIASRMDIL